VAAPKLDRLELYPMPEPATRLAALQAGDIDWAELPPPDSVQMLESQGFTVSLKEYPHAITHQLNLLKAPLDDLRVRQALAYAADREGASLLINNVGYPSTQYMYPGHPWFDDSWEGYYYDPERGVSAPREAGYAPGELSLRMIYPTGGSGNMFPGPMSEKLQQDFAAVGINLELIPLEWNNIITAYREGFANPAWAEYDILYFSTAPLSPPNFARLFVTAFTPPMVAVTHRTTATRQSMSSTSWRSRPSTRRSRTATCANSSRRRSRTCRTS
jgi:peptide/nickel transport system substrate-binding protein